MHIPTATYRIQFCPQYTFSDAFSVIPYLKKIGISDIYASPVFSARKGSTHGYDIVDPNTINEELGGEELFRKLIADSKNAGLFWMQDFVPNHMAFDKHNSMLMDVLEKRENSSYFRFFDILWDHPSELLKGKILAPFLGSFYAEALENGQMKLVYDDQGLAIQYYEHRFPLLLTAYMQILKHNFFLLEEKLGSNNAELVKFLGALHFLDTIAQHHDLRQIVHAKKMIRQIYNTNEVIRGHIDHILTLFNGIPGNPESFDLLDSVLTRQAFRLSFWKVAAEEINYRRFFTINDLICLRTEDDSVFIAVHQLLYKLLQNHDISSVRIDHVDGLYDPLTYLKKLRNDHHDTYIVVEKILDMHEPLHHSWPVQGSVGYDFCTMVNYLFCDSRNEKPFSRIYSQFTKRDVRYKQILAAKKRLIIGKHLAGYVDNLAHTMKRIAGRERYGRDITLYALKRALVEVMVYFPVYRTYVNEYQFEEKDRQYLHAAVTDARKAYPELEYELDYIENYLLFPGLETLPDFEMKRQILRSIMEFQQITGPLMAKGCEDTVFYNYNRLISLNEVGANPEIFGISVKHFHDFCIKRQKEWPFTMNTTATHDTKRGEDTRMRIDVLSEIPAEWNTHLKEWSRRNKSAKTKNSNSELMPDSNDEYFLYQTLIGTFPFTEDSYDIYIQRIQAYIVKAVREAKVHTAWIKPDISYENACVAFVEKILQHSSGNSFLAQFKPFQHKIAWYGMLNSLAQVCIKITAPGVPDFYQGTELWDLSLVDPDNRAPVDYPLRQQLLEKIIQQYNTDKTACIDSLLTTIESGAIKMFCMWRAVYTRARFQECFLQGTYEPVCIEGSGKRSVLSYIRACNSNAVWVVVPRLLTDMVKPGKYPFGKEIWHDTHCILPQQYEGIWTNMLTGERLSVTDSHTLFLEDIFTRFPVAILTKGAFDDISG